MQKQPIIIGIDHIYISVQDMKVSEAFYDKVMFELGFRKNTFEIDGEHHVQFFCRHFGFVIRPSNSNLAHNPYNSGLHHLCLRVGNKQDVYDTAERLLKIGIAITPPSHYPEYAPDYYAFTFKDPDGIRLEVTNYRQERQERHDRWDEVE